MIKYAATNVKDLTPKQKAMLKRLTYQGLGGGMADILTWGSIFNQDRSWMKDVPKIYANIIVAYDTEKRKIAGWSTAEPEVISNRDINGNGKYRLSKREFAANVYVNQKYRGLGLAKSLIAKVADYSQAEKIIVHPHDDPSREFYKKLGAKPMFAGRRRTLKPGDHIASLKAAPLSKGDIDRVGRQQDLNQLITNPVTKNQIKLKTALQYSDDQPVKKLAQKMVER